MKRTLGRTLLAFSLLATIFLAACGSSSERAETTGQAVKGVTVEKVHLQATPEVYEAVGTVRSATVSVLSAQISGTVREVRVRAGDRVRRGQVLAVLDDRSPSAQVSGAQAGVQEAAQGLVEVEQAVDAARAQRQFAEATYHRYQGLLAKDSVSRQEFDNAETQYKAALANERALEAKKSQVKARGQQAQSSLASAETVLSYARVVSPINGIVSAREVDPGTVVMPGTPLVTVEDPTRYRLEASLPARFAGQVRRGEDVSVETSNGKVTGRVAEIVPAADPASRTVVVKVDLPESCGCQAGDYGTASFPVGEEKILAVPGSAIVEQGQLTGVFVVGGEGAVEYRLVKTGRTFGSQVEILSGLSDGERVAVSRLDLLKQGVRIEQP